MESQSTRLFRVTWRSNLLAILAIAKKDWLHFLRYPLNAVFYIFQPIIWLTPIYFLGQSFSTPGGNAGFAAYSGTEDYMSFILLGTILSNYVSAVFWGMGYSLKNEMDSGVLESNWMTPMSRSLLLVGRTLASLATTTVTSAGVLLLGWLFFGFRITGSLLAAVVSVVPMLVALYGFGFAFAALVLLMREPNTLIDISDFVVGMMSGRQFPVNVLPRFLLPISLAIPLTYGFDIVRGYLLGTRTIIPVQHEIVILIIFMGVMIPVGYGVFKLVERHCRKLGTLGLH
jgi:ABC-2 type transport system permease protein